MANVLRFPAGPPDRAERERALDVRASFVVEAPAGSGKTGLLIQRYLKLLGDESVDEPEQVLAITFTRKATGELRERVIGHLEAAASGAAVKDDFDRQTRVLAEGVLARGWGLIEQPMRLKIRTIDSVCAEIAGSLPLLSGGGGRLSPVEEAGRLYRAAARRTLGLLGGEDEALDEALRTILLHRDANLQDCETLIAEMLATREQWGDLVPMGGVQMEDEYLDGKVLPRLERTLELAIAQGLTDLCRTFPVDLLRELTEAANELATLDGYEGDESPIAFCAALQEPPGEAAGHLEHWKALAHLVLTKGLTWRKSYSPRTMSFQLEKHHGQRLGGLVKRMEGRDDVLEALGRLKKLPPAKYPAAQWAVAKCLLRVLRAALVELKLVFAETGECDFAELGLAARTALGRDGSGDELAAALGLTTRHLLVDEMQDTSTSQYGLLEQMTQGWDGRSQTVFLVGDPKQSIYRFRQARVERFVRTMEEARLGGLSLECLRLTANFRSRRRLVDGFNEDFSRLFPARASLAHPEEVPYVEAAAVRGAGGDGIAWHAEVVYPGLDKAETARNKLEKEQANALRVREIVLDWRNKPLPRDRDEPWKIAVLVRARGALGAVIAEFKRDRGDGPVPFRAAEIEALGERPEVLDLLALTRALLHPADRVAWFAVLHGPWCGLGLADLHVLAGMDDPTRKRVCVADLMRERGALLSPEGHTRLERVRIVLEAADARRARLGLAAWVERTWRSLGGDAALDREARANAARFFLVLDELEAESGRPDLELLEEKMTRLYAAPGVHAGAVDLMTIHGAKGLEWDVVIVPALERAGPPDPVPLLDWMEVDSGDREAAHCVLAPIAGTGEDSRELNAWIRSVHAQREAAELKRLHYVACTRAREALHLFATPDRKADGGYSLGLRSLLRAVWPVAEGHFAELPRAEQMGLALAAAAEVDFGRPPLLHRLPLGFNPVEYLGESPRLGRGDGVERKAAPGFERPEGSFAARSFGNAVHAFLELAARRLTSVDATALRAELPAWLARAAAILRADGLAPAVVSRLAQRVVEAVAATLDDPDGRWLLGADPAAPLRDAASEVAITVWAESWNNVRLDRTFRAGAAPRTHGRDYLWIVDYKTAAYGAAGLEDFLAGEREKYAPQLDAYARAVARTGPARELAGVRLALYYPALGRMEWWAAEGL